MPGNSLYIFVFSVYICIFLYIFVYFLYFSVYSGIFCRPGSGKSSPEEFPPRAGASEGRGAGGGGGGGSGAPSGIINFLGFAE